jgi:hypothetical protein
MLAVNTRVWAVDMRHKVGIVKTLEVRMMTAATVTGEAE